MGCPASPIRSGVGLAAAVSKKRPNGAGTVSRDGKYWAAKLFTGYDGARPRYKKVRARTKTLALDALERLRQDHAGGSLNTDPEQTVKAFLTSWLDDVARPRVRESTLASYRRSLERHVLPELGRTALGKLTPQQVQRLLAKLATGDPVAGRKPLAASTIQVVRTTLVSALNQALKWGLIRRNVAALVDPPRSSRVDRRVLRGEQLHTLLESAQGERLYPLLLLAAYSGMRRGELLALAWDDVDTRRGVLRVGHTMRRIKSGWIRGETKTAKSRRSFALPAPAISALEDWRLAQRRERVQAGDGWVGNTWDLVFTRPDGRPLNGHAANTALSRALTVAGIPAMRFHDLRHTAASLLLDAGVDIGRVSDQLGHASAYITATVYRHKLVRDDPTVARTLESLIRPRPEESSPRSFPLPENTPTGAAPISQDSASNGPFPPDGAGLGPIA